jgi:hypothetical protein
MPEDRLAVEAIEKLTGHPIPPMIVEGLDPVDWAEFDGRKRRGRKTPAGKKAPAGKTGRGKRGDERAPRMREPVAVPDEVMPAPAENGHAAVAMRNEVAVPDAPPRPRAAERPTARDAAPRMRSPRNEPTRNEPRRDEPKREARERPPAREERRPDDRQRWRKDDLGPAVVGFGDDVPAFMTVRRRPVQEPVPETEK